MSASFDEDEFPPLPVHVPSQVHAARDSKGQHPRKRAKKDTRTSTGAPAKLNLLDLPTELLLDILDYILPAKFEHKHEIRSAARLCLVNKAMYDLLRQHYYPKMYHSYRPGLGHPFLFLRTLITNPEIAATVKEVDHVWDDDHKIEWGEVPNTYKPSLNDKRIIKSGFKSLGIPTWKEWVRICCDEILIPTDLCTAIMMHAPNITYCGHIVYGRRYSDSVPWLSIIKHSVTGLFRMLRFPHLEQFSILLGGSNNPTLRDLLHVFQLRSIKSLTFSGRGLQGPLIPFTGGEALHGRKSTMQELHFHTCFMDLAVLVIFIKACRALRVFNFTQCPFDVRWFGGLADEDGYEYPPDLFMDYARLDQTFSQQCPTMEELRLVEGFGNASNPDRLSDTVFRSFASMPKLTTLSLPLIALVDRRKPETSGEEAASLLPQSLRSLYITNVHDNQEDALQSIVHHTFARVRGKHLPNLESFKLHTGRYMYDDVLNKLEERYVKEGEELNITFWILRDDESDHWHEDSEGDSEDDSEDDDDEDDEYSELDNDDLYNEYGGHDYDDEDNEYGEDDEDNEDDEDMPTDSGT